MSATYAPDMGYRMDMSRIHCDDRPPQCLPTCTSANTVRAFACHNSHFKALSARIGGRDQPSRFPGRDGRSCRDDADGLDEPLDSKL